MARSSIWGDSVIHRKHWVERHQPVLKALHPESPLTVGNGDFAYSVDISGLQTLYDNYVSETPLCTLANWGWHTMPADCPSGRYTLSDVSMDRYMFCGREVTYAKSRFPGNEPVYDWLRMNPHKFHLARIGFRMNGESLNAAAFSDIHQELHLYRGFIESRYRLSGTPCQVLTACSPESDTLAFRIESDLLQSGLTVDIDFPYASADITGTDWQAVGLHSTKLEGSLIYRKLDQTQYSIHIHAAHAQIQQVMQHRIRIFPSAENVLELAISFSTNERHESSSAEAVMQRCAVWWQSFWEKGGAVDFSQANDPRAHELERRIVLSLYLLAINSSGRMPPAETGLICNSWYGKAHLEMHFWHMAWAPLWGHSDLLLRSIPWYHAQLQHARDNAARNGYRGARWPKMVGDEGIDSPSPIAVLLVWQQPHVIVMLELLRRAMKQEDPAELTEMMQQHWILVKETADFMADYAVFDPQTATYRIEAPVIPVQECYAPEGTRDPSFEVAYWKFALGIAINWAKALGVVPNPLWIDVHDRMEKPPIHEGLYIAHANCPDTFQSSTTDHPSMLQDLGMLPQQDIDADIMARTLQTVIERWDYSTLWGWDFAVMAMTAVRLGQPKTALEQLLCPTNKNTYVISGNNRQGARKDLPLYLPGNGSLLLAVAMMAAGYDNSKASPGFVAEDGWQIHWEQLHPYF